MKPLQIHPLSALAGAAALGLTLLATGAVQTQIGPQSLACHITPEQQEILNHMSIVYLNDGFGGQCKTIRISGVNVQIVNGLGATETANCLGNLIVGYNELGNTFGDDRTGSHNVIAGSRNSYSSYGGLVAAQENTISGAYSSVTGGAGNRAIGELSIVCGGGNDPVTDFEEGNVAWGRLSAVSGGQLNVADHEASTVSGGCSNATSIACGHVP